MAETIGLTTRSTRGPGTLDRTNGGVVVVVVVAMGCLLLAVRDTLASLSIPLVRTGADETQRATR